MSEFIDRLADIIAAQINPDHNGEISRENALHVAGAVVKAMREPSRPMWRDAGLALSALYRGDGGFIGEVAAREQNGLTWRAMIDAAISEAKETVG